MVPEWIKTFCIAVETGSYLAAAARMGVEHSTVSRQIEKLEKHFGVELIEASPRSIQLTNEGEILYQDAQRFLELQNAIETKIRTANDMLAGPLHVLVSTTGMHWLATHLKEFNNQYPEIELSFSRDQVNNILFPSTIAGMTIGLVSFDPPKNTPFQWDEVGRHSIYPYAHPDYLAEFGEPQTWEDLDRHRLIRYQWAPEYDHLSTIKSNGLLYGNRPKDEPRAHCITVDDLLACRSMVENGVGIGLLPSYLAKRTSLKRIFSHLFHMEDGLSNTLKLVYPQALKNHIRVKTLKQFILKKAHQDGALT